METSLKNKTKKFLQLLKQNAQNEVFVGLVTDNLKIELIQHPHKILRVIEFITKELPQSSSDFTRLKINEHGLIPCITGLDSKAQSNLKKNQIGSF